MKVVVTGASGLLGYDIADIFEKNGHTVIRLSGRASIDITNPREITSFIVKENPDCVVHCAGSRDIDYLEAHPDECYLINTFGTKNIAFACEKVHSKLIYISSNAVYDGKKEEGYHEYDEVNPLNVYGNSKLLAEKEVKAISSKYFIIRTAILFGYKGHRENNFIFNIMENLDKGKKVYANYNQICSPTYTKDLAEAILKVADTEYYGTYNISNSGAASRYELSLLVANKLGLNERLVIKSDAKLSGKLAKRPRNTALKSIAFSKTFDITMRDWEDSLENCIEDIKAKNL